MGRVSGLGVWALASAARRPPLEVLTTIPAQLGFGAARTFALK
jgi:hypothetical protein